MKIFLKAIILIIVLFDIVIISSCLHDEVPTVTTDDITDITGNSAISGGEVISEGSSSVVSRGICWSENINPAITDFKTSDGAGGGIYTSNLTGLKGATYYYVRAYATNSTGTGYGKSIYFTTLGGSPSAITRAATDIGGTYVTLNGSVNPNYVETTVSFEYGPTTGYGETVYVDSVFGAVNTFTYVKVKISGLNGGTTYHFRIKTVNSQGTTYGSDMLFTTNIEGKMTDIEGNVYNYLQIGTQIWMKENLKTTAFNDGTPIPNVTDATDWINASTPAYCWFNNDENTYKATYGALYNWYTVSTVKLCPSGWHVPSDEEWTILTDYLGGIGQAGGKLKETGNSHWISPNAGATNSSGFTALPAGIHGEDGVFYYMGQLTAWWSSSQYNYLKSWYRNVNSDLESVWVGNGSLNTTGFSIRCVRD